MAGKQNKSSRKAQNRKKSLKGLAKQLVDFRPGAEVASKAAKGDYIGAFKSGFKHSKNMMKNVIGAITGRDENSKSWYVVYKPVTPAVNEGRPMGALFNSIITKNPTMGTTSRYMEVLMKWEDFTNTYMWQQTITNSFQLLRLKLKSNLPYKQEMLSAYLNNAIQLAIALKQVERDVHWYNYSDPNFPDFQIMYTLRASVDGGYGLSELHQDKLLTSGLWAENLTSYDRLKNVAPSNLRLPPNLALFISHYFGTVFVDGKDGYNDQTIINRMTNLVWVDYDPETNKSVVTEFDATQMTVDDLTTMVVELGTKFGILIADLVNSGQYAPLFMDSVEKYQYQMVYDRSFIQALQNGYTDDSAVSENGFIRLDRYHDVEDNLTQFIFSGGYAPRENGALANVPAITIMSQVLKYNSDSKLKWPSSISQGADNQFITREEPFGVRVQTSISSNDYVSTLTQAGLLPYPVQNSETQINLNGYFLNATFNIDSQGFSRTLTFVGGYVANNFAVAVENICRLGISQSPTNDYYVYNIVNLHNPESDTKIVVCRPAQLDTYLSSKLGFSVGSDSNPVYGYLDFSTPITIFASNLALSETIATALPDIDSQINVVADTAAISSGGKVSSLFNYNMINRVEKGRVVAYVGISQAINTYFTLNMTFDNAVPTNNLNLDTWYNSWYASVLRVNVSKSGSEVKTETSLVTGFTGIVPLVSKETHAGIPIVYSHTLESRVQNDAGTIVVRSLTSLPMLVKHEHIPYFYNVVDLQAVLYDMFTSLFTPVTNIYQLLLQRKGQYDKQEQARRKTSKDKKPDSGSENKTE